MEIEQHIQVVLDKYATPKQIKEYIEDIYNFSDINLYKYVTDEEILNDFYDWKAGN